MTTSPTPIITSFRSFFADLRASGVNAPISINLHPYTAKRMLVEVHALGLHATLRPFEDAHHFTIEGVRFMWPREGYEYECALGREVPKMGAIYRPTRTDAARNSRKT